MVSKGISGMIVANPGLGIAGNNVTEERWNLLLRDKLTISSWVDDKVIRPWNLNEDPKQALTLMPRAPINIKHHAHKIQGLSGPEHPLRLSDHSALPEYDLLVRFPDDAFEERERQAPTFDGR